MFHFYQIVAWPTCVSEFLFTHRSFTHNGNQCGWWLTKTNDGYTYSNKEGLDALMLTTIQGWALYKSQPSFYIREVKSSKLDDNKEWYLLIGGEPLMHSLTLVQFTLELEHFTGLTMLIRVASATSITRAWLIFGVASWRSLRNVKNTSSCYTGPKP